MKEHKGIIILAVIVVAGLLIQTVAYQVDQLRDVVVVKTFGAVTDVQRGTEKPGLRFKWPWPIQKIVRYDTRWFTLEAPYVQVQTNDNQNILVTMFCNWRIRDARKFNSSIEFTDKAQNRIRSQLLAHKADVIGKRDMADLVTTDLKNMKLREVEKEILDLVKADVEDRYGIKVSMVGIEVWGLSQKVSAAANSAHIAERKKYADDYKTAGEAEAMAIRARAKAASEQILAFTERKAAGIRSEGYQAAAELYEHFRDNPELARFLRELESMKKGLRGRTMIVMDGSKMPAINWFKDGPKVSTTQPVGTSK